jgi:hypothetical protein
VLLNDPTYVEASRAFAERIIKETRDKEKERIDWAYRQALSRPATDAELEVLAKLYQKHRKEYAADSGAASKVLAIGDRPIPKEIDFVELASWVSVARAILNLHETITRY